MSNESSNILLILEVGEKLQAEAPTALDPPFACVAWSGGADSTALLHTYVDLLRYRHGTPLPAPVVAVHVDHQLRPDSGEDADFCEAHAQQFGEDVEFVRLVMRDGKTLASQPGSLEANARVRRYALMGLASRARSVHSVLTAHHADDNLETVIMSLIRGAGLTGMGGIRSRIALSELSGRPDDGHVNVVRPLLDVPRVELLFMLKQSGLEWREDPTNDNLEHRRNVVRKRVVPILRSIADSDAPLLRSPSVLRSERELLEEITNSNLNRVLRPLPAGYARGICLSRHRLQRLSTRLVSQILRAGIRRSGNPHMPDRESLQRMVAALESEGQGTTTMTIRGTRIDFLPDRIVIMGGEGPVFAEAPDATMLPVPGRVQWGDFTIKANMVEVEPGTAMEWVSHIRRARSRVRQGLQLTSSQVAVLPDIEGSRLIEIFDASALRFPLRVRPPKAGEMVARFGGGTKALTRIMIDEKVPKASRPFIPVVEDADASFLWAASVVRGKTASITETTTSVLLLDLLVSAT